MLFERAESRIQYGTEWGRKKGFQAALEVAHKALLITPYSISVGLIVV
jgi:hypothetical protein